MKFVGYLLFFAWSDLLTAHTITLGYPEFKPYTYSHKTGAKGLGIEKMNERFGQRGIRIVYQPVAGYGKGVSWLRDGKIDGLLLATQNPERDAIGHFIDLGVVNRWVWFSRANRPLGKDSNSAKKALRIATPQNANTHNWLVAQNYQSIIATTDISAMIRLLMNDRVDTVFIAEHVFLQALKQTRWQHAKLQLTVEKSLPFGVYISKQYIDKHPSSWRQLQGE